mgnify:CR=1 FL=1
MPQQQKDTLKMILEFSTCLFYFTKYSIISFLQLVCMLYLNLQ